MRQQVQVRLVLGEHHRPVRQIQQTGHDPGYHVVMARVAAGGQLGPRQIATSRTRRYSIRGLTCGQPRYRPIRGRIHGLGRASSAAIRQVGWRPPSRDRPDRGRSASPAIPLTVEPAHPAAHGGRLAVQQRRDLGRC